MVVGGVVAAVVGVVVGVVVGGRSRKRLDVLLVLPPVVPWSRIPVSRVPARVPARVYTRKPQRRIRPVNISLVIRRAVCLRSRWILVGVRRRVVVRLLLLLLLLLLEG